MQKTARDDAPALDLPSEVWSEVAAFLFDRDNPKDLVALQHTCRAVKTATDQAVEALLYFRHARCRKSTDAGAILIAKLVGLTPLPRHLDLSDCIIGPSAAVVLADALKVNANVKAVLTSLDLGKNSIGPTGAASLADALKVNAMLNYLRLGGNGIGDAGAIALADSLKVNAVLKKLHLYYNNISKTGERAISNVAQKRDDLELRV